MGEDFVENSGRRCFSQVTDQELFSHTKFDIKILSSKSFGSSFLTTVARVRNTVARALIEIVTPLPKVLFVMLEDDVIKEVKASRDPAVRESFNNQQEDLIHIFGRNVEWLFHEIRKLISAHNDALPNRARGDTTVVWVLPSRHMNYANDNLRGMFGACIQNLVEIHNENNLALSLRQNWDPHDPSIFFFESQRYSTEGLNRFWKSFDRLVWYANVIINKAQHKNSFGTSGTKRIAKSTKLLWWSDGKSLQTILSR